MRLHQRERDNDDHVNKHGCIRIFEIRLGAAAQIALIMPFIAVLESRHTLRPIHMRIRYNCAGAPEYRDHERRI